METAVCVTEEDIHRGARSSHTHCAFCLAMKRAFGTHDVFTFMDHAMINGKRYALPADVKSALIEYDFDKNIQPFSFNLMESK
jgi:hypothetical protein